MQLKALDYTPSPIPGPSTVKDYCGLCSAITHSHNAVSKKKGRFNLMITITCEWHILDNELPEEIPNTSD